MEFNQLKYLVEIVEAGSISKAAGTLFISQPNLSAQVSSLEKEIGRQLFHRNNRGVTLTKEGLEVYQYAKEVVRQFQLTEQKLLNHISDYKVKIVTCGCEIVEPAFLEMCKVFSHKQCEFELEYCNIEQCIEKVSHEEVDLAIIPYTPYQYKKLDQFLSHKTLCMQEIFTGALKIQVSERWDLSRRTLIKPQDLKGLFHVKKEIFFKGIFSLDYEMRQLGLDCAGQTIWTHQNKTYEEALKTIPSFGITLEWDCNLEVNSHLKRIALDLSQVPVSIAVVRRQNEILKKEVGYFLEQLQKYRS
ncbi:MAG: LysR family transcriptional regulator [Cellulosilyticaceae bacterium]